MPLIVIVVTEAAASWVRASTNVMLSVSRSPPPVPLKLAGPVRACDLLLGRDEYAAGYLRWFRRSQAATRASAPAGAGS